MNVGAGRYYEFPRTTGRAKFEKKVFESLALFNENHLKFTCPIALENEPQKGAPKISKNRAPPLLASPACCKQVAKCLAEAARAHFATCLQQAGEARQDKARHCRVRQGDSGRKARWSKATQDKEGSCEARQSKARQGRARQAGRGKTRQGDGKHKDKAAEGEERGGKTKLGKGERTLQLACSRQGKQDKTRQGIAGG